MNVYLDNAATTQMYPEALEEMSSYMIEYYGNPSSMYQLGFINKKIVDKSRDTIASTINAKPSEIYFTSGGCEGDNWAIKGIADAYKNKGTHIITSAIEHKAVLNTCKFLENHGYEVTYLSPDTRGVISVSDVAGAIRKDTILVSIMFANNEIGTVEPIKYIGNLCRDKRILFHTDAVQAYGHCPIDVRDLNVDLLTASSHKFHGPNGVGFVYKKDGVNISSLIHGGQQENGLRGGTENVAGIVGMAKAAELATTNLQINVSRMISLRDVFIQEVLSGIPNTSLNGSLVSRLCNNISFSFDGVPGEAAIVMLDMYGISCSSGSACNSAETKPSHVLVAIGHTPEYASTTLRFTLSELTTPEEIEYTIKTLKRVIEDLRSVYGA